LTPTSDASKPKGRHYRQDLPEAVPRAGYLCIAHGELREQPHFNDTVCCDAVYTVKQLLDAGYTLLDPTGHSIMEPPTKVMTSESAENDGKEAEPTSAPRSRPSALAERSA
jgi:hypothetical protein